MTVIWLRFRPMPFSSWSMGRSSSMQNIFFAKCRQSKIFSFSQTCFLRRFFDLLPLPKMIFFYFVLSITVLLWFIFVFEAASHIPKSGDALCAGASAPHICVWLCRLRRESKCSACPAVRVFVSVSLGKNFPSPWFYQTKVSAFDTFEKVSENIL